MLGAAMASRDRDPTEKGGVYQTWDLLPSVLLLVPCRSVRLSVGLSIVSGKDNYTAAVGTGEVVTGEERRETRDFLDAVMATPCMRYAHQYLVARGAAPADEGDFKVHAGRHVRRPHPLARPCWFVLRPGC